MVSTSRVFQRNDEIWEVLRFLGNNEVLLRKDLGLI